MSDLAISHVQARRPATDIFENDDAFLLVAELPGVKADELEVNAHEGTLSLSTTGEHSFARDFVFDERADLDGTRAKLVGGLLELHVPKAAAAKPLRIQVASS